MTVNEPPVIESVSSPVVVTACTWMLSPAWMVMVAADAVLMTAMSLRARNVAAAPVAAHVPVAAGGGCPGNRRE